LTSNGGLPPGWPAMSIAQAHARLIAPGARFEIEERAIGGISTRVWKNCPPTLREVFLSGRAFAQRTFLVYENDRATFEAFARAVIALAHEL
jgi:steroid-24-oyl-CoA synthetase